MAKAPKASAGADTALVKALADILDDAGLAELEYETEAVTVRLSRVSGNMAPAMPVAPVATPAAPVGEAASAASTASAPIVQVVRKQRFTTSSSVPIEGISAGMSNMRAVAALFTF